MHEPGEEEPEPSPEEVRQACAGCCGCVKFIFVVWVFVWQYNVVSQYALRMPLALWDGNHVVPMTDECAAIYFALQRSLLCTILEMLLPVFIFSIVIIILPRFTAQRNESMVKLCGLLVGLATMSVTMVSICSYVVCIMGLVSVWHASAEGIAECHSLDNCAWYVFLWLMIFNCCFQACCGIRPYPTMPTEPLPDHYKALEVAGDADQATIKTAWRKLQIQHHPDKVKARTTDSVEIAQSEVRVREINAAWAVLQDSGKRAKYDQDRETQRLLSSP